MVRFKAGQTLFMPRLRQSFNPTMVRFKVTTPIPCLDFTLVSIPQWFDSKEFVYHVEIAILVRFNPTMVRFKVLGILLQCQYQECFNPTMVRFKAMPSRALTLDLPGFNPTMVRFKGYGPYDIGRANSVSIPQWFDSKVSQDY